MKRAIQMTQEKTAKIKLITLSLLINLAILAVLVLFFTPTFETNDDTGLLAIVCGSRGTRDPHMVHSNYLLGLLLGNLFESFPDVQWMSVLQYVALFCSFTSVTFAYLQVFKKPFIRSIVIIALSWFAYEGYIKLQYTKTAGMIVAMGLIVIFSGLLKDNPSYLQAGLGGVLTIIGSFYRMQSFYCGIALFAPMVLYLLMSFNKDGYDEKGRITKSLILGAALILVAFGFRAYDRAQYNSPEWENYLEFDKYRTEVIDYGVPDYEENVEEYNAIGIDETAYALMKDWTFQDNEKFTAETFKAISELKEKKKINLSFAKKFMIALAKGLLREKTFLCFSLIALGWLIMGKHGRAETVTIMALAVMVLALYMYLYYVGRFMIHRVDVGIWMSAALIVLFLYNQEAPSIPAVAVAVALLVLFATKVSWTNQLDTNQEKSLASSNKERETVEEVNADQDHIYLTKVGNLSLSKAYGTFEAMPFGIADNVYPLGGWGAGTPVFKEVLKRYGINNPFRDMIDNEKAYLIDDDIDATVRYLKRWYDSDSRAELINTINGKNIYRIVTG